ncbi:Stress responsive A/B Barrel Domain [Anaerocolumna jejuensis DSM 15929]|uniref:Stress responsive A/B Barrel Domain n=1 Tax=Anaerocolumna jejuensis DSM 15929 TaxID=1121322 RepID=A0A1M6RB36_9FIRM|nr:Dabb family protein [Anaerocolumna jejuensis]SHK29673.1 Stress responsive A/B Barrel Domain [Anaerocolumna jejuensis DSM 15929]
MVRHLVLWKYKEELTEEERNKLGGEAKKKLEALKEIIPGILSLKVITKTLPTGSGNCDLMLDSTFISEEALDFYQNHEEHIKAASFVRSIVGSRICVDYEE